MTLDFNDIYSRLTYFYIEIFKFIRYFSIHKCFAFIIIIFYICIDFN